MVVFEWQLVLTAFAWKYGHTNELHEMNIDGIFVSCSH